MDERWALCWLGVEPTLSLRKKYELLDEFGSALGVYQGDKETYRTTGRLDAQQTSRLMSSKGETWERWLEDCQQGRFQVVTKDDDNYPVHLRHIPLPPLFLYFKGRCTKDHFQSTFGVVGSRKASLSGRQTTRKMARELAASGLTIVSGLALGIDAQAHWGALDAKRPTVAVLGCGIDRCYPAENQALLETILVEDGVVFSEFPGDTPPLARHFPMRNRILSGISMGVLVAEAEIKSGSLVTAKHATEQGREVYAFPGDLHRKNTLGSNLLLRDGAKMVLEARDILEDLAPMLPISTEKTPFRDDPLSHDEQTICTWIQQGVDTMDGLMEATGFTLSQLILQLTFLEIRQKVVQWGGKYGVVE